MARAWGMRESSFSTRFEPIDQEPALPEDAFLTTQCFSTRFEPIDQEPVSRSIPVLGQ